METNDPKDGGGRIASGTAIERNAGAFAELTKSDILSFVYFVVKMMIGCNSNPSK